jgi:polyisoprenoid-binding protein YceI
MRTFVTLAALLFLTSLPVPGNAAEERGEQPRARETYAFDKAHTSIGFGVKHMVISTVKGRFTDYSGTIVHDTEDVTRSTIDVTIQTASINTDNQQRDDHLRSADFFDAAGHPTITFKSSRILRRGEGFVAVGNLTIREVTREVELRFQLFGPIEAMGSKRIGADATLTIDRKDYGVSWSRTLDNGGLVVSDEVTLELHVELIKQDM